MSAIIFHAYTVISSQVINLTAYHQVSDGEFAIIEFCIQNSCDYISHRKDKIAITKWLQQEWACCAHHLKTQGLTPMCTLHQNDGKALYRYKAYRKMGFVPIYGVGLIWGYLPRYFDLERFLEEKGYPPLPEEPIEGIEYVEWHTYYEPERYSSGSVFSMERHGSCHYWHDTKELLIEWKD